MKEKVKIMKYYLAPLEGITGYIYRNAYEKTFHNVDKYFTPFIVANKSRSLKTKELKDVLPENNTPQNIVPQILTNSLEDFNLTVKRLMEFGYDEVNINLGCPSGTVVSKNKGAGFLALKEELDRFLDGVFESNTIKISLKTRIGKTDAVEFYDLINIYNKYPLEELIIHPRVQKDFYNNVPNLEIFEEALKLSVNNICYNGDIFSVDKYNEIVNKFQNLEKVMLGRGIIRNPGLIDEIKNGTKIDKNTFKIFHDDVLEGYIYAYKDNKNVLFKMKELWYYMGSLFSESKKYVKEIRKAQKVEGYIKSVEKLLNEQEIVNSIDY